MSSENDLENALPEANVLPAERDPAEQVGLERMADEFGRDRPAAEHEPLSRLDPPFADYERLRVPEVIARAEALGPYSMRAVIDFERQHRNRVSLIQRLERRLRGPARPVRDVLADVTASK